MVKEVRVELPDALHRKIKLLAMYQGKDMKVLIPELLEKSMSSCEVTVTIEGAPPQPSGK